MVSAVKAHEKWAREKFEMLKHAICAPPEVQRRAECEALKFIVVEHEQFFLTLEICEAVLVRFEAIKADEETIEGKGLRNRESTTYRVQICNPVETADNLTMLIKVYLTGNHSIVLADELNDFCLRLFKDIVMKTDFKIMMGDLYDELYDSHMLEL
ncbi:hypothetical protein CHS0354_005993 [Potamilus streckersoni]|uniref:Uncharacterized protein n=1 Tax=Potamilus streckersoni TaxID=2493646 RepID=A0AAE0RNX6_9BIVA|nr:hypothetical protein CHS0354_005993 [Potamilus streckersoni]